MYDLEILGNNQYRLYNYKYGSIEGTLREVIKYAVFDLGFSYKELELALLEMHQKDHNSANFGVFGSFIFSYNKA